MALEDDFLPPPPPKKGTKLDIDSELLPPPPKKKEPTIGLGYEKPSEALRMGGLPKQEKLSQSPLKTAATTTPSVSTKRQWTQQDQKSLIEKIKTGDLTGQTPEEDDYLSRIGSRIVRGMNTLNYNLSKTPEFVYNLAAYPQNVIAETFDIPALAASADKVKQELGIQNEVADYYKDQINQLASLDDKYMGAKGSVTTLAKEGKYLDAAKLLGEQIAESLPTTAAIAASGGLGASSTAITLGGGAVFGAAKYDELADRTDLTESQKTSISFATGLTEGLFENLGTGNIGRIVKDVITKQGAAQGKEVAKGMFVTAYKDALKKYMPVSGALSEGIEEAGTQFAQNAIDIYTGVDPQKKLTDGLIDAFAVGTGSGLVISSPALLSKDRNKKVAEKQVEVDEIDSEINNPNLSDDAKATLAQKRGKIMSDINDVIDEDVNEQRALPDATKREIEQIQDGLEQIGIDIENTKSEFAKKELESKRVELESRIDELTKAGTTTTDGERTIEGAVSTGTDVAKEGLGVAAEPGKEGVAGEDIQAEKVRKEVVEAFGDDAKDLEDFYYESKRNGTNKEFVDEYESMFPPKETQQKIEIEKSNEIEKESNNKIINGEADPIVSKIVSEHTFTDEDNNLIDKERGDLDRDSFINKKIKEIISGSKLVSDKIKKALAPIVDKLKKIIIGISIVSSVGVGKQVSSYQPINNIISEKISSDIANVVKMPYSDIANIGTNAIQKFLEIGDYADTESTLGLETSVDMTGVKESNIPSIGEKDVIIGEATSTTKDSKYKIKPYIINLLSDSVKIKLADNKFKKNRKPFKDQKNSLGIMGSTNGIILFKEASDYQKSLGIQMVYDEKTSKIVPKMNSDVAPNDIVFLTSEGIAIPIDDLDMKPNNNGGFDIKKGKDNENGTAILLKKDGNSFHIGWAAKADEAPSFVSTEKAKEFKILRGGMVWLYSTDGEVAVAVSGSLNDIFSEYKRLQEKNPNKKFILFRGDTGSYSTPAFTETNETTADDVSKYSTRNTYGNNVHLVLMKPDAPLDKGLPVGEMGLSPLLALALLKRKKGLSITKEEQDLIDNREKQKQYETKKETPTAGSVGVGVDIKSKVYHGGGVKSEKDMWEGEPLFVSKDKSQAHEYTKGNNGEVVEFLLDNKKIATEEDARKIIAELGLQSKQEGWNTDELNLFELIDPTFETALSDSDIKKVFEELENKGYEGIEFTDTNLKTLKQDIQNIVVFNPKKTFKAAEKQSIKEKPTAELTKPSAKVEPVKEAAKPEVEGKKEFKELADKNKLNFRTAQNIINKYVRPFTEADYASATQEDIDLATANRDAGKERKGYKEEKAKKATKAETKKTKPEEIGEGLLDILGIAPVEPAAPAKKAGKTKPVNVSNKSELAELEDQAEGDKKTIIEAAKKGIATLRSIFPDMEIYIHEDPDSYNETMSEVGGVANSRGNFAFERDANDNPTGKGRIDINLSNAKDTTVAHELVHAVLLKEFGDNPAVFKVFRDRMSKILRADLNEQVTAFEKLYSGQDVAPEEYLTELAALLSQGGETVEYKPSTLRRVAALINEFVSKITKGKFQPFRSEVDFKNFVDFLNQISGAIRVGDVINNLNNKEAYSSGASIPMSDFESFVAKKVSEPVKSKSQIGDYKFPDKIKILKTADLPIKNLTDLVREYKGKVVIITSDATGYGVDKNGDPIFGGFGFSANAKNVNDGIGFASVSIGTVKGTYTAAEKAYGEGKALVLVMIQPPHTTINNSYGSKYIIRGIKEIATQSKEELAKTKEAIKEFIKNSTAIQNELKTNEASLKRGSEKKLIELIDNIDENTDLDSAVEEFIADTTFTIRKELGKGIILENKDIRTNKSTNYAKIALNNAGYNIFNFLKEYGDNTFLSDEIILNNTGGFVVGGFELDVLPAEEREKLISETQSKGIVHPLFNAKLPGTNHFRLDGLYDVQENFSEYVRPETVITLEQKERDKLVRKYYKEDRFYSAQYRSIPLSKRTYTQLTIPAKTEFKEKYLKKKGALIETIPNIGTKVAKGEGFIPKPGAAEQMAKATMVSKSQRVDKASDKLKQIFQRDNIPLTIAEAKTIVEEVYDWTTWYDGLATYVYDIFGEYSEDILSMLPLASMAANSSATVGLAINNAEKIYRGEKPSGVAEYYGYVTDFLEGKGIKSDKMSEFFKALTGNKDAIAVDMHVYSIIMGKNPDKKQVNPSNKQEFDKAKEFVRTLASELDLAPREVQAALWAANILRTGGRPDSYEQYFKKQIDEKRLKERIENWRNEGYKPFSEIRKDAEASAQKEGATIKSKSQKAQNDKIKEFIEGQRKAGQSDKDIKAGLELVADKVGLTKEDINDLMSKEVKKEKSRAFATKAFERAGVPVEDIPSQLRTYTPTTVEEQQKIAEDFIRKHGIDNTISELRLKDSGIDPKNKPVLASVLLNLLYEEQNNTKDVAKIEKIAIDVYNVLDATLTAATQAAQFMAMMREFYNSNPYNYVAQVTRLIEKNINNPIKAKVTTAVVNINNANKAVAGQAASNVVKEVVTSKVTSAKEKFERSKANLKALWKKSFNIGIAANQYEAAKNDVQFAKALTIMAKDFVVYQSVQFSEFLKEVASQIGLQESDIDQDHLRKIFEKAKSEKIQQGIKVGLKELELKLKDLIESHYSAAEIEGKLIDKLKVEFGLESSFGLNDAAIKELEAAIKREIKVLTAKEKIKALKAAGIKEQKDVDEILALSEEGLLNDSTILETLGDKLGIKKLTPEESKKLADLAKDIKEAKEDRIKARNIQKFEDYKFILAKKYKIQDFLLSNYLTNIFGSLTSNQKNIAGNVSETILLVGELVGNALASGNPKDIQRALKALVDGNIRGFDFTKEVLTTGVASYKEPGDIRARNMWELIMDRENDLTRTESVLQFLFKIPYLGPTLLAERRFWNRALLSMDSLSGTTNNELGSLLAATREADKQKLRGAKRTKFIQEQMANSAEAQEEARDYAISLGYKPGTGEFNRSVQNYLVSKRPEAIKKAAAEYSARATLTQTPPENTMTGAIANGLNNLIAKNPSIKFFVPVVNTFANLIVKNIERSPFEIFSLAFDAGRAAAGVESAKAGLTKAEVARRMKTAAVWTGIAVLLFALAGGTDDDEEGFEIFGSGTGDPAVDNARRALGWKPNTFRFSKDGGYYNFEFLPFGFVLGMIGNMRDYFKYKNKPAFALRQAQAKKIFGKNLDALTKDEREQLEAELAIPGKYNLSEQERKEFANLKSELALTPVTYSFQLLKSLGELVNAVGEGAGAIKTGMKAITNIGRGIASPRYLGEVRDIFDNKLYDTKEFRNVIGANVPFVKLGNVKLDAFGREIEKYKSESLFSGIKYALTRGFYNPPTITALDQFLWENGVGVSVPSNTPSMAYTEDVYREYIVTRGKILITNLTEALKNKEFEGLSPQDVLEVVNIYVTNANAEARDITDEKLDKLK